MTLCGACTTAECATDTDCVTPPGICTDGTCVPVATTPPASCRQDTDCANGRVCRAEACVFAPACRVLSGTWTGHAACGDAASTFSFDLVTDGCDLRISGELGDASVAWSGTTETGPGFTVSGCAAAAHDHGTGAIRLDGCAADGASCTLFGLPAQQGSVCCDASCDDACTPAPLGMAGCEVCP